MLINKNLVKLAAFFFFFSFLPFMAGISVASVNVNGARHIRKRAVLYEVFKEKKLDIVFLQETHSDVQEWTREWDGISILSHNTAVSGGLAILFSKSFKPVNYDIDEIIKGRLLKVKAFFENHVFIFICVYAPTSGVERMLFLNQLNTILQNCNSEEWLIVGGDFNCTEGELDRNHIEPHEPSRKRIIQVIKTHELSDIWRHLNGNQRHYTWSHNRDNVLSLARLDRFYTFKHQCGIFSKCFIVPVSFSDHSMVCCNFFLNSIKPKSAYWHLNSSLLYDKNFVDSFNYFWVNFRTTKCHFKSLKQWWDYGKVLIKQFCQQHTRNITVQTLRDMKTLETSILKLQESVELTGENRCLEALSIKKTLLSDLLRARAQGALVRSRFQQIDQMDAPTKLFFNLEQKNGQKRIIHALRSEAGFLLTDPTDIRKRAVCFYEKLYKGECDSEPAVGSGFLENLSGVSEEDNQKLSKALCLEELYEALMGMESGKAPGIDGLPVDFYKSFWTVLGEDLLAVLNESLTEGRLPLSCRRAVLTLLPKKGDLIEIKNWRPVSLLCTDYKLLSKLLTKRLSVVMRQIIHPDQSYCVSGRSIFDNISLLRDFLDVSKIFNLDCV